MCCSSKHTDINEDTTNESANVACSNMRLQSWTLTKNEEIRLDAFEMRGLRKILGFRRQQRKQMSGFLTKLE